MLFKKKNDIYNNEKENSSKLVGVKLCDIHKEWYSLTFFKTFKRTFGKISDSLLKHS